MEKWELHEDNDPTAKEAFELLEEIKEEDDGDFF